MAFEEDDELDFENDSEDDDDDDFDEDDDDEEIVDDEEYDEEEVCEECGAGFDEEHVWDCPYADEDDDEDS